MTDKWKRHLALWAAILVLSPLLNWLLFGPESAGHAFTLALGGLAAMLLWRWLP